MSFSHDSRSAALSKARTTSQPAAASDQDMDGGWSIRRQVPRILVVDDNPGIATLMSQLLSMRGYEVVTAADAQQAEAEVRRQAPDLILSDVRMPGIDGLELQRRVRLKYPRLPVIFITAHYDNEIRQRALRQGAAGFLHKPFDAADLLGAIELALNAPPEK